MKRNTTTAGIKKPSTGARAPYKKPRTSIPKLIGAAASPKGGPEWKDFTGTATALNPAVTTEWSVGQFLAAITQGAGAGQRIGRKVTLKSILIRYNAVNVATRFVVVYDRSPDGIVPLPTTIFQVNSVNSVQNLEQSDRFWIMKDVYVARDNFSNVTTGAAVISQVLGSCFISLGAGLQQGWNNTAGGTIADCTSGAVYLYAVQASNVIAAAPIMNYTYRVRYTDS